MRVCLALALLVSCLAPAGLAQPPGRATLDFELDIHTDGVAVERDPEGMIVRDASEPGEWYEWRLAFPREYVTAEIRVHPGALNVTRARQVVPILGVDAAEYPLFEPVHYADVWNADSPARIANHTTSADGVIVLRLGFTGPWNGTFRIARDVRAPSFTLGEVTNVTHYSFYQETRTDEPAYGDLEVRRRGEVEWVRNPTPAPHFRQRFPVQGLDADTYHEARVTFTDWAGNSVTTPTYVVRTAPEPERPLPTVTPLSPTPNETAPSSAVVRVAIASVSPVDANGVRLFFDKQEIIGAFSFNGTELSYAPGPLAPGKHSVSVEATNAAGGRGEARWTFVVDGGRDTPAPWLAGLAAASLFAALVGRRPKR